MRGIIRQRKEFPVLPALSNRGTILRVLLAVNGAALVVAFAREQRWNGVMAEWIGLTSYVEPHLLMELVLLALIAPWLSRQRYAVGAGAIVAITIAVGVATHALFDRMLPGNAGSLPRQLIFALAAATALLSYFRLRVKALSPAVAEARLPAVQARIPPPFLLNR